MANRFLGEGDVSANGKTYRLRFDMNVLADLQDQLGKNPVAIMEQLQADGGDLALLRRVCRAMLQRHHPEADMVLAGDILSEGMDEVMAVIASSMPDDAGRAPGNRKAKAGARR